MRFLFGALAAWVWSVFIAIMTDKFDVRISEDAFYISMAVIAAGAMAGGGLFG